MFSQRHVGTVAISLLVAVLGGGALAQNLKRPIPLDPALAERQAAALRVGGLRAAAEVNGYFVGLWRQKTPAAPATVANLVEDGALVAIGRPKSNVCELTASGRQIVTRYQVEIDTVLNGPSELRNVSVVTPGGRVSFERGLWAQVNTPGLVRPVNGKEYLWILVPAPDTLLRQSAATGGRVYVPKHGGLGFFDLSNPRLIVASGASDTHLARNLAAAKLTRDEFIHEIRNALAR